MEDIKKENKGLDAWNRYRSNKHYYKIFNMVSRKGLGVNKSILESFMKSKVRTSLKVLFNDTNKYTFYEKKESMFFLLLDAPLFYTDIYYNCDISYNEEENMFFLYQESSQEKNIQESFEIEDFVIECLQIPFIYEFITNKDIEREVLKNLIIKHLDDYIEDNYLTYN